MQYWLQAFKANVIYINIIITLMIILHTKLNFSWLCIVIVYVILMQSLQSDHKDTQQI